MTEDRRTLESAPAEHHPDQERGELLTEAAGREHGLIILPTGMKAATVRQLLGKLTEEGLITSREQDGDREHHLTPAGYRARSGLKHRAALVQPLER